MSDDDGSPGTLGARAARRLLPGLFLVVVAAVVATALVGGFAATLYAVGWVNANLVGPWAGDGPLVAGLVYATGFAVYAVTALRLVNGAWSSPADAVSMHQGLLDGDWPWW